MFRTHGLSLLFDTVKESYFKKVNLYNQHLKHWNNPTAREQIDIQHVFCSIVSKCLFINV